MRLWFVVMRQHPRKHPDLNQLILGEILEEAAAPILAASAIEDLARKKRSAAARKIGRIKEWEGKGSQTVWPKN